MNLSEYRKKLQQDPEYLKAKKKVQPLLDLANDILRLRIAKGWTQEELAERVGTKQANISRIESGLGNPTIQFINKIGDALGADLDVQLVEREQTRKQSFGITKVTTISFLGFIEQAHPVPGIPERMIVPRDVKAFASKTQEIVL